MAQTHFLPLPNKHLITSISFNYYGTRLAVSSLDHHLYVLSADLDTGKWPDDPQESTSYHHPTKLPNIHAWNAHEGPVIKVIWSDPIHGEILASAGTDGTVRIWEEETIRLDHPTGNDKPSIGNPIMIARGIKSSQQQTGNNLTSGGWYQQTILADSNRTIRDIGFSPSESSLRLASISTDHYLRLYECLETNASFSTSNDNNWNLIIKIDLSVLPVHPRASSDHLNPNLSHLNLSGLSNDCPINFDPTRNASSPYQRNDNQNPTTINLNLMNPSSGLKSSFNQTTAGSTTKDLKTSELEIESVGGWALTWCPDTYWGDILATSSGSTGLIRLFRFSPQSQWENFGVLNPFIIHSKSDLHPPPLNQPFSSYSQRPLMNTIPTNHTNPATSRTTITTGSSINDGTTTNSGNSIVSSISSLAWAPTCGRDYHLLAAGHRDGRLRIWKLVPPSLLNFQQDQNNFNSKNSSNLDWSFELDAELDDHIDQQQQQQQQESLQNNLDHQSSSHSPKLNLTTGIGKCDWNITGTVLSTSGSDGKVRVWKMGYKSRWINTGQIDCINNNQIGDDDQDHTDTTGITIS